jgi:hypothetical protein
MLKRKQVPQKKPAPKSNQTWVQLAKNFVAKWPEVLEGVELKQMPIDYVDTLAINLKTHITIIVDIKSSLKRMSKKQAANMVKDYIAKNYSKIKNVDINFNFKKLKTDVQSKTKAVLDKTFS